jgi:hypothetical protein
MSKAQATEREIQYALARQKINAGPASHPSGGSANGGTGASPLDATPFGLINRVSGAYGDATGTNAQTNPNPNKYDGFMGKMAMIMDALSGTYGK